MPTDKAQMFLYYWNLLGGRDKPEPVAEYRFDSVRKWRFDWAFPDSKVAVEVEGNAWQVAGGGKHMQDADLEKYNAAASAGWRIFRFSPGMLRSDPDKCIDMVRKALK